MTLGKAADGCLKTSILAEEAVGHSHIAAVVAGQGKYRAVGHILRGHRVAPAEEVDCRTGLGHMVAVVGVGSLLVADCNCIAAAVGGVSFLAAGRSQQEHRIDRQVVVRYMTALPGDGSLARPWCHMMNR